MNLHTLHWAVITGSDQPDRERFDLSSGLFHGTAFGLGSELFLTAGHVYTAAATAAGGEGRVSLARFGPADHYLAPIEDAEVFLQIDVALLHCPGVTPDTLPFLFEPLEFLADVFSLGYAFGFEPPYPYLRAFQGHVVTRRRMPSLPGAPPGYEVSFVPPVGLSGAPLLTESLEGPAVAGIVLQHHAAEYRDRRMGLGLVLDIEELLTLHSRILDGSVAEKVFGRPLLVRSPSH